MYGKFNKSHHGISMQSKYLRRLINKSRFFCDTLKIRFIILFMIIFQSRQKKLIRRSLLFIFYWGKHNITSTFIDKIDETMRIVVVTNPRDGVCDFFSISPSWIKYIILHVNINSFRLYYNQDKPQQNKRLALVNWWSGRLFNPPALPNANTVFNNFEGKIFKVPVFHVNIKFPTLAYTKETIWSVFQF